MPTIAFESSTIFYREFGDAAAPPLFLIHGLYSDSTSVEPLAVVLAARFRVITPDMLGHGRSSRPDHFSLADQGRAVNHLIGALGYESSAVVGVSMGSYVAAQAAILEPARTSRLILVVPKAHGTTSSVAAYAARQGIDLRTVAPEQMLALMAGALWSPATSEERRNEIMAAMPADQVVLTAEEQAAVERSLANFDLRPDLPKVTAPTLVISGRADGLNPPEAGEELAKLIPSAEFTVYERAGHMHGGGTGAPHRGHYSVRSARAHLSRSPRRFVRTYTQAAQAFVHARTGGLSSWLDEHPEQADPVGRGQPARCSPLLLATDPRGHVLSTNVIGVHGSLAQAE